MMMRNIGSWKNEWWCGSVVFMVHTPHKANWGYVGWWVGVFWVHSPLLLKILFTENQSIFFI